MAPAFALTVLSSQGGSRALALADLRGKAVVVNFWASWCDPCKEEAPLLENAWKQAQAQGKNVVFVGIDFQEAKGEALGFLQAYNITYPLVLDTSGAVAGKYSITSLPDTIFINSSGIVVSKIARQITAQVLTSNLQLIES
jgi:cytochrome c biogenesis protein CcmG/thiol:disulfide interchange protein DsbE